MQTSHNYGIMQTSHMQGILGLQMQESHMQGSYLGPWAGIAMQASHMQDPYLGTPGWDMQASHMPPQVQQPSRSGQEKEPIAS